MSSTSAHDRRAKYYDTTTTSCCYCLSYRRTPHIAAVDMLLTVIEATIASIVDVFLLLLLWLLEFTQCPDCRALTNHATSVYKTYTSVSRPLKDEDGFREP